MIVNNQEFKVDSWGELKLCGATTKSDNGSPVDTDALTNTLYQTW